MISDLYAEPVEFDSPIELEEYEVAAGTFGMPVQPSTFWGTLTVTMTNCDSGHAAFNGLNGSPEISLARLVRLPGMDCSPLD